MKYVEIAIAVDQLANALLSGYADETLSARAWRVRNVKYLTKLHKAIDFIFFWDLDHCFNSYKSEVLRKHLPMKYQHKY